MILTESILDIIQNIQELKSRVDNLDKQLRVERGVWETESTTEL